MEKKVKEIIDKLDLKMQEDGSIYDVIDYAKSMYPEYPNKPAKPRLKPNHTPEEAMEYAKKLVEYQDIESNYKQAYNDYKKAEMLINDAIEEYIKQDAGLYTSVPQQYQDKVWSKAWSDGHSSGYSNVYYVLISLVEIFE